MKSTHTFLAEIAARAMPRILTQICRDPGSPAYGACDRNWWHYKIRDFPSIILQQAGYTLALASGIRGWDILSQSIVGTSCPQPTTAHRQLAAATALFWNQRALKHGAFEEYYPFEQGYPPLAFSTLAVAKLAHMGIVPASNIRPGLAVAAKQLLSRFEAEAANQQIAGTAALCAIRTIAPDLVQENAFQPILTRTLELQHPEGWFPEYDGPDLGYLAVSIDCLYDIHDHTSDPRILPAIRKAAGFISWFVLSPFRGAGMHNSRNTDYITPYGLVRLALEEQDPLIEATVAAVFNRQAPIILNPQSSLNFHPFDAVDDRYWCHYIGPSVFRALLLLQDRGWDLQSQSVAGTSCPGFTPPQVTSFSGSGHAMLAYAGGAKALVSTRKGGIVTAIWPNGSTANDFGWIVQTSSRTFVTHWWSTEWKVFSDDHQASCEGFLVPHKEHLSAPWKHIILRIGSFCLGRHLIRFLKRLVIFKKPQQTLHFIRSVRWDNEILVIRDKITGLTGCHTITRAPRTSKRHVASADSYQPEDFELLTGTDRTESALRTDNTFTCESRYARA